MKDIEQKNYYFRTAGGDKQRADEKTIRVLSQGEIIENVFIENLFIKINGRGDNRIKGYSVLSGATIKGEKILFNGIEIELRNPKDEAVLIEKLETPFFAWNNYTDAIPTREAEFMKLLTLDLITSAKLAHPVLVSEEYSFIQFERQNVPFVFAHAKDKEPQLLFRFEQKIEVDHDLTEISNTDGLIHYKTAAKFEFMHDTVKGKITQLNS